MEDDTFSVIEHMRLGLLKTQDWVGYEPAPDKRPRWLRRQAKSKTHPTHSHSTYKMKN